MPWRRRSTTTTRTRRSMRTVRRTRRISTRWRRWSPTTTRTRRFLCMTRKRGTKSAPALTPISISLTPGLTSSLTPRSLASFKASSLSSSISILTSKLTSSWCKGQHQARLAAQRQVCQQGWVHCCPGCKWVYCSITPAHQGMRRDTITWHYGTCVETHNLSINLAASPGPPLHLDRCSCLKGRTTASGSGTAIPSQQDFWCHIYSYIHEFLYNQLQVKCKQSKILLLNNNIQIFSCCQCLAPVKTYKTKNDICFAVLTTEI